MTSVSHTVRRAQARRTAYLAGIAALLGVAGGGAAWVLVHLIGLITNVVLFHQFGWDLPSFADFHPGPILLLEAAAGGLVVALLAKWSPVIKGHGIPEAMEAVLTRQSRIAPRAAVAKPASAAVAIGTGGPFGAEGPIIVTGGAMGSLIGQLIRVTPSERKILLACGAAAGMAATFGAPLAAVVLAIELLLFEYSHRAFVPLVVAASVAGAMHALLFSPGPLFHVPTHNYAGLDSLPVFALVGISCGLLAVVICKGLFLLEGGFRWLPIPDFWHPIIGALGFACVGLVVPRALGVGYDSINDVLADRLAIGVLALLLVGKLLAWWIALGSGTSGGTLAPILLISGCFGSLLGALVNEVVPELHLSPGAVALVAMAATFGAATRATFTAIVFAFELTRDYRAILPIMLAAVIADLVAGALLDHGLMTEKLARRGLHVPLDYAPDYLQSTRVDAADDLPGDRAGGVRPGRRRPPSDQRDLPQRVPARRRRPPVRRHRLPHRPARQRTRRPTRRSSHVGSPDVITVDARRHPADRARADRGGGGRAPSGRRSRPPHRGHVHTYRHPASPPRAPGGRAAADRLAHPLASSIRALGLTHLRHPDAPSAPDHFSG